MNDSVLKGNAPRNNGSSEQDIGDMTFEVFFTFYFDYYWPFRELEISTCNVF